MDKKTKGKQDNRKTGKQKEKKRQEDKGQKILKISLKCWVAS